MMENQLNILGEKRPCHLFTARTSVFLIWFRVLVFTAKQRMTKKFHWLYPGKEMVCGLKMVALDTDCKQIRDCVAVGSIAEIYVELYPNSENDENDKDPGRDVELLMGPNASSESEEFADHFVALATCPPTDNDCVAISNSKEHEEENSDAANDSSEAANENSEAANENSEEDEDEDSSESDYCPDDDIISDEDEEAVEINKKYKEYKAKMKAGQLEHLDDAMLDGGPAIGSSNKVGEENDGNGTAYEDSSDLYDSFDEIGSDGEVKTFRSRYRRFKDKGDVPEFTLGMKFDGKEEFRQAIIRYGLHHKKLIRFPKNDKARVRAKCDWPTCPWVCLLSKTTRSCSWQISSFHDVHLCPKRSI